MVFIAFFICLFCVYLKFYIYISCNPNTGHKLLALYAMYSDLSECWNATVYASKLLAF